MAAKPSNASVPVTSRKLPLAAAANGTRSAETMMRELASTVKVSQPDNWRTALTKPCHPPAFRQKRTVSGDVTELRELVPGL
ncbi:hypothetical protein DL764_003044 [Monosporascus ibericus]|uniref:Uncharacterized protein n=1 Tax=Monosporascus ibericus TaxID=155417 RepID=A0A4Q4TM70_9PEZI|nr:hypothetical protein DL764_003044 [Monosporascus ibericus]